MTKAKVIDRLELTRQKFGNRLTASKSRRLKPEHTVGQQIIAELTEAIEAERANAVHRQGYSTCPNCGQETLIHEDGCMHCRSCGWSACG